MNNIYPVGVYTNCSSHNRQRNSVSVTVQPYRCRLPLGLQNSVTLPEKHLI